MTGSENVWKGREKWKKTNSEVDAKVHGDSHAADPKDARVAAQDPPGHVEIEDVHAARARSAEVEGKTWAGELAL